MNRFHILALVCWSLQAVTLTGCAKDEGLTSDRTSMNSEAEVVSERTVDLATLEPRVRAFCADCHVMPRPSSSPREEWVAEVDQGFDLQAKYGRKDLEVPSREDVLKYFQALAPKKLTPPASIAGYPAVRLPLRSEGIQFDGKRPPRVTDIHWADLGIKGSNAMIYCDIANGGVMAHWPQADDTPTERLATLLQPVQVATGDLDNDGLMDLVVADIGEFDANDTDLGRIVWLRRRAESETFRKGDVTGGTESRRGCSTR